MLYRSKDYSGLGPIALVKNYDLVYSLAVSRSITMGKTYLRIALIPMISSLLWLNPAPGAAVNSGQDQPKQDQNQIGKEPDLTDAVHAIADHAVVAVANFMRISAQDVGRPNVPAFPSGAKVMSSSDDKEIISNAPLANFARYTCTHGNHQAAETDIPFDLTNPSKPIGSYGSDVMEYIEPKTNYLIAVLTVECRKEKLPDTAYVAVQIIQGKGELEWFAATPDDEYKPQRAAHVKVYTLKPQERQDDSDDPSAIATFGKVVKNLRNVIVAQNGNGNSGDIAGIYKH